MLIPNGSKETSRSLCVNFRQAKATNLYVHRDQVRLDPSSPQLFFPYPQRFLVSSYRKAVMPDGCSKQRHPCQAIGQARSTDRNRRFWPARASFCQSSLPRRQSPPSSSRPDCGAPHWPASPGAGFSQAIGGRRRPMGSSGSWAFSARKTRNPRFFVLDRVG
jgi:hypothetical protein